MSKIAEILADGVPVDKAALRDYLERREAVNARDSGVEPGVERDAAPALQAAIDDARGAAVFVPPGSYRIATPLIWRAPAIVDGHIPGLRLIGAGSRVTRFDCRVSDGAALRIDQSIGYT